MERAKGIELSYAAWEARRLSSASRGWLQNHIKNIGSVTDLSVTRPVPRPVPPPWVLLGISRRTWFRRKAAGTLPRPTQMPNTIDRLDRLRQIRHHRNHADEGNRRPAPLDRAVLAWAARGAQRHPIMMSSPTHHDVIPVNAAEERAAPSARGHTERQSAIRIDPAPGDRLDGWYF